MATVIELRESRLQIWERMKQINDLAEKENRDLSGEEKANWEQANADITALDARIERQERLERTPQQDTRQVKLSAAVLANPTELRATKEYREAYSRWMQFAEEPEDRGILRGGYVQYRAMGVSNPTLGGLLVPESLQTQIEQAMLPFGAVRNVARVVSTGDGGDMPFPTSDDTSNTGEILAEGQTAGEQDASVGAVVLRAFTFSSKIIKASVQFLQDSSVGAEAWLAGLMGERVARIQNTVFTTGAGANSPQGIVTGATSGVAAATGNSTTINWDYLVDLEHSVNAAYRIGARYMLADTSLAIIRKLKDGEGRYLWQPGTPTSNVPGSINGYPYVINDDVAAMTANAKSVLFGQFSKYLVRDVRGFGLVRFSEKYMDQLQVGFLGFSRADGALLDAGTHPIKYYANSAS